MSEHERTRREVLKKAMYVPPAILTLAAMPSFASAGSSPRPPEPHNKGEERHEANGFWKGEERHEANGFWEEVQRFLGK